MPRQFDVVILGDGIAGCTCAASLLRRGHSVCLLSKPMRPMAWTVDLLSPIGLMILNQMFHDLTLDDLMGQRIAGIASRWGSDDLYHQDFIFLPTQFGLAIDRSQISWTLHQYLIRHGCEVYGYSEAAAVENGETRWSFDVAAQRERYTVSAHTCIDATGARASIARAHGVRQVVDDHLIALPLEIISQSSAATGHRLWIESVEYGWWYAIPHRGGRIYAALVTDSDTVRQRPLRNCRVIQEFRRTRIAGTFFRGSVDARVQRVRPFVIGHNGQFAGPGWFAVGDAAVQLDPVMGAGLASAVDDALGVSDLLSENESDRVSLDSRWNHRQEMRSAKATRDRDYFYGLERRWPNSPFWSKRQNARQTITMPPASRAISKDLLPGDDG